MLPLGTRTLTDTCPLIETTLEVFNCQCLWTARHDLFDVLYTFKMAAPESTLCFLKQELLTYAKTKEVIRFCKNTLFWSNNWYRKCDEIIARLSLSTKSCTQILLTAWRFKVTQLIIVIIKRRSDLMRFLIFDTFSSARYVWSPRAGLVALLPVSWHPKIFCAT